jgi:anti-sigma factor RsiW
MNAPRILDETALLAYVDGEIDDGARPGVEAWLAEHPEDAARVHAYRAQNAGLHELFDGVLEEPLPAPLAAIAAGRRRTRPAAWMRIAAAVALFVIGGATGWGLHGVESDGALGAEPGFVRRAVGAHIVYVSEVRHPVEVGGDQEAHLVGWLSKRLGAPLRAPKLASLGFQLVGGRLLPDDGMPAAQFMYEDGAGRRITCYVRASRDREDTAFRFIADRGVSAFYWVDAPLSYALIAEMPKDALLPVAHAVYQELDGRGG